MVNTEWFNFVLANVDTEVLSADSERNNTVRLEIKSGSPKLKIGATELIGVEEWDFGTYEGSLTMTGTGRVNIYLEI